MAASTVYDEVLAFSTGFVLARKEVNRKGDKWTVEEPIRRADKKALQGLWCVSPKAPTSPWVQLEEDLPDDTLAEFRVREAAGEYDISCTYPKKDLLEDHHSVCERAYESGDTETGGLHVIETHALCFHVSLTDCIAGDKLSMINTPWPPIERVQA